MWVQMDALVDTYLCRIRRGMAAAREIAGHQCCLVRVGVRSTPLLRWSSPIPTIHEHGVRLTDVNYNLIEDMHGNASLRIGNGSELLM